MVVRVDDPDGAELFYATDVSESGVGFLVLSPGLPLAVGATVQLTLTLPSPVASVFRCRGEVRRLDGARCGIALVDLRDSQIGLLRNYVATRLACHDFKERTAERVAVVTC
ncbi:MAG: PilZ domain-containing protein [Deltaproteobacteria bacterium]|nr:PilZ domain-containing protein [Deltaproteobacteria bacterium]